MKTFTQKRKPQKKNSVIRFAQIVEIRGPRLLRNCALDLKVDMFLLVGKWVTLTRVIC